MGDIYDKGAVVYRDFEIDGVAASGLHEPTKAALRDLIRMIDVAVYAAAAGITQVDDLAARDTFYADANNQAKLVYVNNNNGSADDPANGVYEYVGGGPRIAAGFYQGVASIVQPLVDVAEEAASEAAAAAATGTKAYDKLGAPEYTDTAIGNVFSGEHRLTSGYIGVDRRNSFAVAGPLNQVSCYGYSVGTGRFVLVSSDGVDFTIEAISSEVTLAVGANVFSTAFPAGQRVGAGWMLAWWSAAGQGSVGYAGGGAGDSTVFQVAAIEVGDTFEVNDGNARLSLAAAYGVMGEQIGPRLGLVESDIEALRTWHPVAGATITVGEYYNRNTGVAAPNPNFRRLSLVDVTGLATIKVTATVRGLLTAGVVWLDEGGARIGMSLPATSDAVALEYRDEEVAKPEGAVAAAVCSYYSESAVEPQVKVFGVDPALAAGGGESSADGLDLLTALWVGTSIPAGAGSNNYPDKIAELLRTNVNNVAIGSSMMRAGLASAASGAVVVGSIAASVLTVAEVLYGAVEVGATLSPAFVTEGTTIESLDSGAGGVGTYNLANAGAIADVPAGTTIFVGDDPLGWSGLNWDLVTRALSHTIGEKMELINNWAKWQPVLTAGPPAAIDSTLESNILGWSYENRILGHALDSSLLLFDHGYNDSLAGGHTGEVSAIPVDSRDRGTFIGATNWVVDRVEEYLDGAGARPPRIGFVGHYDNTRFPDIAQAQEYLSALWGWPILKTWERTGWTQQTITTTGHWVDGVWVASGGAPQTITLLQRALADGLHPHTDVSEAANNKLAAIMAPQVRQMLIESAADRR